MRESTCAIGGGALVSALAMLVSCGEPTGTEPAVASFILRPASDTIANGESVMLRAELRDASGNAVDAVVSWTSSDETIVEVSGSQPSQDGVCANQASSHGGGTATITASVGDVSASATITVLEWHIVPRPWIAVMDIWGSGPNDVWAVGYDCFNCLMHWDGAAWDTVPGSRGWLFGVWNSGPNDVWAVGDKGLILHYDGVTVDTADSPTSWALWAVWGSGPNDVWAVGDSATVLHFDGVSWSDVSPGMDLEWPTIFTNVWGLGPSDVWVLGGRSGVIHFDGSAWTRVGELLGTSMWGSSPSNLWMTSRFYPVHHYDGSSWHQIEGFSDTSIDDVWGFGPSDIWVVGGQIPPYFSGVGRIFHYNGSDTWLDPRQASAWSFAQSTYDQLRAVWGSSPADIWFVGGSAVRRLTLP